MMNEEDDDDQYVPLAVKLLRSNFVPNNENRVIISSFIDDESPVDLSPPVKRPRVDSTDQASDSPPLTFRRLLDDMVNEKDQEYYGNLPLEQLMELGSQFQFQFVTKLGALCTRTLTLEKDLAAVKERNVGLEKDLVAVEERNVALEKDLAAVKERNTGLEKDLAAVEERNVAVEKDLAAVKESLEAKFEVAEGKLAESERLAAFERVRAEEVQRLLEDSYAQHEKKVEEVRAEHATRLEEFHKCVVIRLREARDEGRLLGFNTCLEQFMNLAHLPEGIDFDFLSNYADGMGGLDVEDGASGDPHSEAAVLAHLIKDAVLSVELRKKFIAALESLFGKPLEVDSLFFRRATFRASSGRFTFMVQFSLSLQFPEHQPVLLLESSQHFDAQGVPVKSQNLTQYPWSSRWEASEMAGQIFDFLAEEGLSFKKYCNQLNQQ